MDPLESKRADEPPEPPEQFEELPEELPEEPAPAGPEEPEPQPPAEPEAQPDTPDGSRKRKRLSITRWFEARANKVAARIYDTKAEDLEERARRVVGSAYRDSADDLQERAVQAMRRAIAEESDRIKEVIEHSVQVKKREVRLSLVVLVVASLLYLALYWFTHRGGPSAS